MELLLSKDGCGDYSVNKAYKKELFDGVSYPVGWIYEDIATTYRVFARAKTINVLDKQLYFYRRNEAGISHSKKYRKEQVCMVRASNELHTFVCSNYPDLAILSMKKLIGFCVLYVKSTIRKKKTIYARNEMRETYRLMRSYRKRLLSATGYSAAEKRYLDVTKYPYLIWKSYMLFDVIYDRLHNHPTAQQAMMRFFGIVR